MTVNGKNSFEPMSAPLPSRVRNVQTYEDLEVYKSAFEFQQLIFGMTKSFPQDETYTLTDQVRRSSRSVGANLAEAWAKRRYPANFLSKLSDSDGELQETIHWLNSGRSCGYIDEVSYLKLKSTAQAIGAMLGKMMANHESWCHPQTR